MWSCLIDAIPKMLLFNYIFVKYVRWISVNVSNFHFKLVNLMLSCNIRTRDNTSMHAHNILNVITELIAGHLLLIVKCHFKVLYSIWRFFQSQLVTYALNLYAVVINWRVNQMKTSNNLFTVFFHCVIHYIAVIIVRFLLICEMISIWMEFQWEFTQHTKPQKRTVAHWHQSAL